MRNKTVLTVAIFFVLILVIGSFIFVSSFDKISKSNGNSKGTKPADKKGLVEIKPDSAPDPQDKIEPEKKDIVEKPIERKPVEPKKILKPEIDPEYKGTGKIFGKIFGDDGKEVNDAVVQLLDFGGSYSVEAKIVWEIRSSETGDFSFDGVKEGEYKVAAYIDGVGFATSKLIKLRKNESQYVEVTVKMGVRLYGIVKNFKNDAVEGAEVHCTFLDAADASFQSIRAANTRTDENGEYEFSAVTPGSYWVQVTHNDYATASEMLAFQENTRKDFSLTEGGAIHGFVKDENGEPVKSFRAKCFPNSDETAEDLNRNAVHRIASQYIKFKSETGEFTFTKLSPDKYAVEVLAESYAQTFEKKIIVNANETTEIEIILSTGVELKGAVLEKETEKPIENAKVSIAETIDIKMDDTSYEYPFIESQELTATTDSEGRFSIKGLSKKAVHVWISHDEFPQVRERVNLINETTNEYKFYMIAETSEIYGVVYNSDKQPVKGRNITIQKNGTRVTHSAQSDENGEYRIEKIAPGGYLIMVISNNAIDQIASFTIKKGEKLKIDLGIDSGITVKGQVTSNGKPVSAKQITFTPIDKKVGFKLSSLMNDGTYKIVLSEPGRYSVLLQGYKPGMGTIVTRFDVDIPDVVEFEQNFEIPQSILKGKIVSEATNEPVSRCTIFLETMSSKGSQDSVLEITRSFSGMGRTNSAGEFAIHEVVPGKYRLKIVPSGLAIKIIENVDFTAGTEKDLGTIFLKPETKITGFITDETGAGIPGASIVVSTKEGHSLAGFIPIRSGKEGKYEMGGFSTGTYKILVHADGYARKILPAVKVSLESELNLDIKLQKGASLTVFVKDAQQNQLVNAEVALYNSSGKIKPLFGGMQDLTPLGLTDITGAVKRKSLEPGLYTVIVSKDGYVTQSKKISLSASLESELEVVLYNK